MNADYFNLLGVQPLQGRFFAMEECVKGKDHVIVLTQSFWEANYHADPAVVGQVIRLSAEPFTIIGVAPRSIEAFNSDAVLFKPFELPLTPPNGHMALSSKMYARVKTGIAPATALAQLDTLEHQFYQQSGPGMRGDLDRSGHRIALGLVRIEQTKPMRTGLLLLQGGALFVLLLGCANVANLMLARANARQAELAIRQALGAGRGTLARQLFTESLLLAALGGIIGFFLAWASLRVVNSYTTAIIHEAPPIEMDGTVLSLTVLAALTAALLACLLPVLRMWQADLLGTIRGGTRDASASGGVRAASGFLVTTEVALALLLLIGACLLLRSFAHVLAVDPGFDSRRILHARVALNTSYQGVAGTLMQDRFATKLREIPGVDFVSMSTHRPLDGQFPQWNMPIRGSVPGPNDTYHATFLLGVSPEFFKTMGIRIVEGRGFSAADNLAEARKVFIVDRDFAVKYFPGRSAVGEGFVGPTDDKPDTWSRIIGVAEVAKLNGPEDRSGVPFVYAPIGYFDPGGFSVEVRTTRSMTDVVPLMRAALRNIDPTLPLYQVNTLQMSIDDMLNNRRGVAFLLGAFAGIALLLSAVGIYGMLAYDVTLRTKEIGIRGALGATRTQIVTLILRQGLWKSGVGLIIGLGGAFYLSRYMGSLLFDVKPTDPLVFAGVSLLLLLVALLASWLPARRAAKVDPVIALRAE